jgi:iron complex outermembrane receptor protein
MAALSMPAIAQDGASGLVLEEIVVTSERRQENLQSVPLAITALSGTTIEELQITTTEGLSQFSPSLYIYAEAVGSERYTIRGIGRTTEDLSADPGVAVFLNDAYLPRQGVANMGMFDVERVEVLKGPQGTLYGKNASAGVINIITRAPTEELSGYVGVDVGNFGRLNARGAISGALVEDRVSGRLAFQYESRDGLYRNLTTGQSANDIDARGVRATMRFKPSQPLVIDLIADWARSEQHGVLKSIISDVPGLPYEFFTRNPVTGQPRPGVTLPTQESNLRSARSGINGGQGLETRGVVLNATYGGELFDFVSITSARDEESYSVEDNGRAQEITSYADSTQDTWSASQEFRFLSNTEGRFSWTAGLYFFHQEGWRRMSTYRNVAPFSGITTFRQEIETDSYAIFGEGRYKLTDRLSFTAGVRYTIEEKDFSVDAFATRIPGIPATGQITPFLANGDFTAEASERWSKVSPKGVLQYEFSDDALAYASVSKGFKSGGFAGQPPEAPIPKFAPEDVTNYEIGLKAEFFGNRLRTNVAVFYSEYDDLQLQSFDLNGLPATATANARNSGIELEIMARLTEHFTVRGGASFTDPEYVHYISQQPGFSDPAHTFDMSGKRIGGMPSRDANLILDYELPIGSSGTLGLQAQIVHAGDIRTEFGSTLWAPSYTKGDVNVSWEPLSEAWKLTAWVNNVTDKLYYRGGGPLAKYQTDSIRLGLIADPRSYGLSMTYRF